MAELDSFKPICDCACNRTGAPENKFRNPCISLLFWLRDNNLFKNQRVKASIAWSRFYLQLKFLLNVPRTSCMSNPKLSFKAGHQTERLVRLIALFF